MIQTSSKIEGKPNAYIMIMYSRTLSQRDNVQRMRRFVSHFEKWRLGRTHAHGPDSNLSECSNVSTAKPNSGSSRKAGRKAVWRENVVTDMVDIICSREYLRTILIFRNTSRARNTTIYTDVVKQLKERLGSRGEKFPAFDVTQIRNKFKKCVAECKKAVLTIKTATGIKRFQEEKNFGEWFSQLYSFVKTRDSCTPESKWLWNPPDQRVGKVLRLLRPPRLGQTYIQ